MINLILLGGDWMEVLTQTWQLEQLYELRQRAYRIEAQVLGVDSLPPLQRSLSELLQEADTHIGIYYVSELVAALSFDSCWINSLVVHPNYFRQGLASQLLAHVLSQGGERKVTTGADNLPAIGLYEKYGFRIFKRFEVPGLQLVELRTTNN